MTLTHNIANGNYLIRNSRGIESIKDLEHEVLFPQVKDGIHGRAEAFLL